MNLPANKSEIIPWLLSGWRLIVLLGAVLVIGLLIWWAYSGGGKDETPYIANIGVDNGKNAVIANQITNQEQVVNNAENIANQANANLANSILRDSNSFSSNSDDADNAFCSRFPCDSSCARWRQSHPQQCR